MDEARKCASAMQGLAEVEGNPQRVTESKQRIERDIGPLSREVKRQLDDMGRNDLFGGTAGSGYQAPGMQGGNYNDMDRLLSNSEDMLRGSLAYVAAGSNSLVSKISGRCSLSWFAFYLYQLQTLCRLGGDWNKHSVADGATTRAARNHIRTH